MTLVVVPTSSCFAAASLKVMECWQSRVNELGKALLEEKGEPLSERNFGVSETLGKMFLLHIALRLALSVHTVFCFLHIISFFHIIPQ